PKLRLLVEKKWSSGLDRKRIEQIMGANAYAECSIPIVEMVPSQVAIILREHYGLDKDVRDTKKGCEDPLAHAAGERLRRLKMERWLTPRRKFDKRMLLELELLSMDFYKNAHGE